MKKIHLAILLLLPSLLTGCGSNACKQPEEPALSSDTISTFHYFSFGCGYRVKENGGGGCDFIEYNILSDFPKKDDALSHLCVGDVYSWSITSSLAVLEVSCTANPFDKDFTPKATAKTTGWYQYPGYDVTTTLKEKTFSAKADSSLFASDDAYVYYRFFLKTSEATFDFGICYSLAVK
jgi:hypothetical protein